MRTIERQGVTICYLMTGRIPPVALMCIVQCVVYCYHYCRYDTVHSRNNNVNISKA